MGRGHTGRRLCWTLGAIAALIAAGPAVARAQPEEPSAQPRLIYSKNRAFRIPISIPAEVRSMVREVRLWVSEDFGATGRNWARHRRSGPSFRSAPRGTPNTGSRSRRSTFRARSIRRTSGRSIPSCGSIVDTAPPTLVLEPHGRRGTRAAVRWEIQDENLVLRTLVLEYQVEGSGPLDWRTVPLRESDLKLSGAKAWDVGTSEAIRVRAVVSDWAKNSRQVEIVMGDGRAAPPGSVANSGGAADWDEPPPRVAPIATRSGRDESFEDDPFASVKGRDRRVSARDSFASDEDFRGPDSRDGTTPASCRGGTSRIRASVRRRRAAPCWSAARGFRCNTRWPTRGRRGFPRCCSG